MNTQEENLSWSALEYEDKKRSDDWFWALGIIVVTSAVAALIYSNYFFAILIVLAGMLLAVFAKKKPSTIYYQLDERGLKINNRLFPYENIRSFWVQADLNTDLEVKPTLFLKSERLFIPVMSIPIENISAVRIRDILLAKSVPEEEMKENPFEKIMESLGF